MHGDTHSFQAFSQVYIVNILRVVYNKDTRNYYRCITYTCIFPRDDSNALY